jgi:hypothetical protein
MPSFTRKMSKMKKSDAKRRKNVEKRLRRARMKFFVRSARVCRGTSCQYDRCWTAAAGLDTVSGASPTMGAPGV